jgi:hypothetical protein
MAVTANNTMMRFKRYLLLLGRASSPTPPYKTHTTMTGFWRDGYRLWGVFPSQGTAVASIYELPVSRLLGNRTASIFSEIRSTTAQISITGSLSTRKMIFCAPWLKEEAIALGQAEYSFGFCRV